MNPLVQATTLQEGWEAVLALIDSKGEMSKDVPQRIENYRRMFMLGACVTGNLLATVDPANMPAIMQEMKNFMEVVCEH